MSGQIDCTAPLPEGPADTRLAKLLVLATYVVPEKKAKKKATGTRKSARCLEVLFKGAEAPASATEDRRFSTQRHAYAVSCLYLFQAISFS